MESALLNLKALNQYYGQSHTLWDINLAVKPGSRTCLVGRNGMGKTTLLKAIMGLLPVESGEIEFSDQALSKRPADLRAKLGIGYVPQGREIFAQLSVEENLKIGLIARQDGLKEVPEKIYQLFPVLKEMRNRRGGDLSGGQQQQLAIGRALTTNPKLLILDEPTEGIQPNIVQMIGDILVQLNEEEGLTVLLVEQKLPFVRRVANEFLIISKGKLAASGGIDQLSEDLVQKYLTV